MRRTTRPLEAISNPPELVVQRIYFRCQRVANRSWFIQFTII